MGLGPPLGFTLEHLKNRKLIEHFRLSVEALLNSNECSDEETMFYSAVLQTLNWVLLRDTRLPLFRDPAGDPLLSAQRSRNPS